MARLYSECIRCQVKNNLENYPEGISEELKIAYMQGFLKIVANTPADVSAPLIARDLDQLRQRLFGEKRDFTKEKLYYNQLMLEKAAAIKQELENSEEPLKRAIQYAMIGNYIDFGANHTVVDETFESLLKDITSQCPVNPEVYEMLIKELQTAKKLLYLTDNCGEIVMDKLMIQTLQKLYPHLDITVMVRGEPVLNDASMEDAIQVGLPEIVKVTDNGTNVAGTWIPEMPQEAKEQLTSADLILAKGQGNFESMQGCGLNVFYIFLCKCTLFAKAFGVPEFTGMIIHEKDALDRRRIL